MASKKLKSLNAQEGEELKMDMSPMIDMVFLLLIFFIVVSTPKVIEMDAEVKPAVAYNADEPDSKHGRIVVNIREDGTITDVKSNVLDSEEEIAAYVRKEKEQVITNGYDPRIMLRGDKESVFRHTRMVVRAGASVGVTNVIFSAYNFEN